MLFWMRPESHVAAAKIVRSSRRCLIGASSILHRTSSDTRRVEPSKASTRSSNRSTRSSSVTSAAARAGRGPTSRGARTRCPGRPRPRRRPRTTGRSRCPSRASSHRVEVAQRRRRELRARERARDALCALVRLPRHVHGQTLGRVRVRLGARGRGLDELGRAPRTRERADPGVGDEPAPVPPRLLP